MIFLKSLGYKCTIETPCAYFASLFLFLFIKYVINGAYWSVFKIVISPPIAILSSLTHDAVAISIAVSPEQGSMISFFSDKIKSFLFILVLE